VGKLIAIVGNNASGKTTLAQALCARGGFRPYLEQHVERPFQSLFAAELERYALPNQIDYLLYRAEQEWEIRTGDLVGVQDGGLEQDFHLYTHLFHHKGFLGEAEYELCRRFYASLRRALPPPDAIIRLRAPLTVLEGRLQARGRAIDRQIVTPEDLPILEKSLDEWLRGVGETPLFEVDAGASDPSCAGVVERLLDSLAPIVAS